MKSIKSIQLTLLAVGIALGAASGQAQSSYSVYDTDDSFVLNPGSGSTFPLAAGWNFGGLNSRAVASAGTSKGEFDSVLRFDLTSLVTGLNTSYGVGGWSLTGLSLTLNTSSSVNSTLFNAGASGSFNICWMSDDGGWTQGIGTQTAVSTVGITYNSLQSTLSATPATMLNSAAYVAQGTLKPATYSVSTGNTDFMAALLSGGSLSLLLTPADDHVAFNFTSHGYSSGSNPAVYSPALTFEITAVPEPGTVSLVVGGLVLLGLQLRQKH